MIAIVIVFIVRKVLKVRRKKIRMQKRRDKEYARLLKAYGGVDPFKVAAEKASKPKVDDGWKRPNAVSTPRDAAPPAKDHYFEELLEAGIAPTEELPLSPKPWSHMYFDINDETFHLDL